MMLSLVISQTCWGSVSIQRLTDNPASDIFGATSGSLFNERTPQSLYLIGDTVHLLWARGGVGDMYNRSRDRGSTWDWCTGSDCHGIRVLRMGWESSIVAKNSKVYAIGYCWDCSPSSYVPFNRSVDNGTTWDYGDTGKIVFYAHEYGGGPRNLDSPVMETSLSGDTILLVVDAYSWGIRVKRSFDGGNTWGPSGGILIASPSSTTERHPQIAFNGGGRFFVCYVDFPYVKLTYSNDYGSTWSTPQTLDTLQTNLYYNSCHVAASGNYVSVAWFDKKGNAINVFYRESNDGGTTWTPKENITGLTAASDTAAGATVVNRLGNVYLTWFERSSRSGGNFEIFTACKSVSDATWRPTQRITFTSGRSLWPMVNYSAGFGHGEVCWQDDTPGNYEIYCTAFTPLVGNDELGLREKERKPREDVNFNLKGRRLQVLKPFRLYRVDGSLVYSGEPTSLFLGRGAYILLVGGDVKSIVVR